MILKRNNWFFEVLRKGALMGIGEGIYDKMEEFSSRLMYIYKPLLKNIDLSPFQENPYAVIELVTTEHYLFYLTNHTWANHSPIMEVLPEKEIPFTIVWKTIKPKDWAYSHSPGFSYNYPGMEDRHRSIHELIKYVNKEKIDKQMSRVRSRFELLDLE